jgi:hypothetical protein
VKAAHRFAAHEVEGLYDWRQWNGSAKADEPYRTCVADLLARTPEHFGWRRPTSSGGLELTAVVGHEAAKYAAEEVPRSVQPAAHLVQGLRERRPNEHVTAHRKRDKERPELAPLPGAVFDVAHHAEIDLSFFAGGGSSTRTVTAFSRQPSSECTKRRVVV